MYAVGGWGECFKSMTIITCKYVSRIYGDIKRSMFRYVRIELAVEM